MSTLHILSLVPPSDPTLFPSLCKRASLLWFYQFEKNETVPPFDFSLLPTTLISQLPTHSTTRTPENSGDRCSIVFERPILPPEDPLGAGGPLRLL